MGLLLSVLAESCYGVLEAVACYEKVSYGLFPHSKPNMEYITRKYNDLMNQSTARSSMNSDDWMLGGQGYLEIKGGGKDGPIKASIKYFGGNQDSTSILFSTKISSFGQDSVENEKRYSPSRSPDKTSYVKTQIPQGQSFNLDRNRSTPNSSRENLNESAIDNFWGDEPADLTENLPEEPEKTEKIKWHYRPLTPLDDSSLPEIHFDSYERQSHQQDEQAPYSEDFLRSLDGVKFRPLQRDDGTGRRRSYKKRHSSSSTSSRDSKASREEELKIFTSLEESEFENFKVPKDHSSAPNLSIDSCSGKKRHRSRERSSKSPSLNLSVESEHSYELDERKSPSVERPHLKDIPKQGSFDEVSEIQSEDLKPLSEIESTSKEGGGTKKYEPVDSFGNTAVNW